MLHSQKVFLLIEVYLGVMVLGHAALGIYKSFTNRFTRKAMGMDGGKFRPGAAQLILTGSALLIFLIVHVKQFRLGVPAVAGDIHSMARSTLADPKMAAGYCVAVGALGFHLWKGWNSVLLSLKIGAEHTANAVVIGRLVCLSVCASFIGAVGLFSSASAEGEGSVLVALVGEEMAKTIPAELVALAAFAASAVCSLPVVLLVGDMPKEKVDKPAPAAAAEQAAAPAAGATSPSKRVPSVPCRSRSPASPKR